MKKINYYFTLLLVLAFFCSNANAKIDINASYFILQDYYSGKILKEKDAETRIYPASMTKIMTVIVVFDLIEKGETSFEEMITISENAWRMSSSGYSSMFVMLNDKVSVEDLLRGIIVVSGNDACVALAEGLAGTEMDFVILMNEKAHEIGMYDTLFSNSSGINDPNNYSTVKDIMLMSRYLIQNYPEYYLIFKEKTFTWERTGGDPITQGNRNPLLYKNLGADGIKTGYLIVEKYSLASSIKIGERRLIAVASGFPTKNARSNESIRLYKWGLRMFDTIKVAEKNKPLIDIDVWLGKDSKVGGYVNEDFYLTVKKRKKNTIVAVAEYSEPIEAPVNKGDKIGVLNVSLDGELVKELDIFSSKTVDKLNIFSRILKYFNYLIWGDV